MLVFSMRPWDISTDSFPVTSVLSGVCLVRVPLILMPPRFRSLKRARGRESVGRNESETGTTCAGTGYSHVRRMALDETPAGATPDYLQVKDTETESTESWQTCRAEPRPSAAANSARPLADLSSPLSRALPRRVNSAHDAAMRD